MSYKVMLIWATGTVTAEPRIYPTTTPKVGDSIEVETRTGHVLNAKVVKIGGGRMMITSPGIDIVQAVELT